ncbi:hypothetical protein [Seonamhaeicola marinus]|uniref:Uncharacterized protein n=1 Tax=Seonamhaeicola marinus TaxID=1912246 RepID=A0A5D0HFH7_9FLAO|nr:hypothetical protein [Seonamhaeicola marinus]TYA70078.1 hypothetical protein FUA24_22605 [Seonamhaeicola marinus]
MRKTSKSALTQQSVSELSFYKRFKYKIEDFIKPTLDPKISFFSRLEKQIVFFVILFFVVAISIFMVLEFGHYQFP